MAIDGEAVNHEALENEAKVKKQFEKLKYSVERLDRNNENRRPDFLISNASGFPLMLCEVKTINSAGCGVSTHNEKLEVFEIPLGRMQKQIDDRIEIAAGQRAELVKERPQLEHLPFVVTLFLNALVSLDPYPRWFNEDVSGILMIKPDVALGNAFDELSDAEQERRLKTWDATGLPPNSKDFVLVRNKQARRKVPKGFSRPVHFRTL
jgi:hypothetical protein